MLPSGRKRLRQLEEENAKLKKDVLIKNLKPAEKRDTVCYLPERFQASDRKSSTVLRINRGWHRRRPAGCLSESRSMHCSWTINRGQINTS